jgi:adenylate cyclase
MTTGNSKRKLAVVMFTDMVGYTALMQENEQKARQDRDRHRQILEQSIPQNSGRIVQYFGDGTMCVFDSAIQAVKCALELQTQFQLEPKIPVRIGLHVGDIVYEEDGIYGDAVNVAARIEAISVPGGVLFSDKVFDDIKNHPIFHFNSLGEFKFKNVKRPIEVFALTNPQLTVPSLEDLKGKKVSSIKRVAVLPFTNMSSDPENEYFSDGMSEELINAFTKVEGIEVTARTSAFAFKGKNIDIREIGSQLSVDTILEGSVRKAGNRVRVTAQLINTSDGYHLFSETYDRDLDDIFTVQDEIALEITRKLTGKLKGTKEEAHLVKPRTENLEAYNIYLKGIFYWNKWTPEGIKKSIECFEEALSIEPDFASASSWLSFAYTILGARGNLRPEIAYPKAKEYAQKALQLDDELYTSHLAIGQVKLYFEWDWDGAEQSIKRALELNPGSGWAHQVYGNYLSAVGRLEEGVAEIELSVRLDPLSLTSINYLAFIYYMSERYDDAMIQLDKILEMDASYRGAVEMKGWAYLTKGELNNAIKELQRYHAMTGSQYKGLTALGIAYARAGRKQEAQDCLKKMEKRLEMDENEMLDMELFVLNAELGDIEKGLPYLEKVVKVRSGGLLFMKSNPAFKSIINDPRVLKLLEQTGLDWK